MGDEGGSFVTALYPRSVAGGVMHFNSLCWCSEDKDTFLLLVQKLSEAV